MFPAIKPEFFDSNVKSSKGKKDKRSKKVGESYHKYPRGNSIDEKKRRLAIEYVAMKILSALVKSNEYSIQVPNVEIVYVSENDFYLKKSWINDTKSLDEQAVEDTLLIQALILDLIVLNIDGHRENIRVINQNEIVLYDYDLANSNSLKDKSIVKMIDKITQVANKGFAQANLIKGNKAFLVEQINKMLKNGSFDIVSETFKNCTNDLTKKALLVRLVKTELKIFQQNIESLKIQFETLNTADFIEKEFKPVPQTPMKKKTRSIYGNMNTCNSGRRRLLFGSSSNENSSNYRKHSNKNRFHPYCSDSDHSNGATQKTLLRF